MGRKESSLHSRISSAAENTLSPADSMPLGKSRSSSVDATVITSAPNSEVDRSLSSTKDDEDEYLSDELVRCLRRSKMNDTRKNPGPFSRAAAYLRRSNRPNTVVREAPVNLSEAPFKFFTVDDRFASTFNNCDSLQLPELRKKRASVAPIVCEETHEDEEALLLLLLDHENQAIGGASPLTARSAPFYTEHKWSVRSRLM